MFFEMLDSFKGHVQLGDLFRIVVQESDFHAQYTFMQFSLLRFSLKLPHLAVTQCITSAADAPRSLCSCVNNSEQ